MKENLSNDFLNSLIVNNLDIIQDYGEIGIDTIMENINDNEILKEIPIVKTIVSIIKISHSIYERNTLKNIIIFINELNSGSINKEKLKKYKERIQKDNKKCEKELGRILIILDSYIENFKSTLLSKAFKAYINERINWKEFCEISEIIDRIFIEDLEVLKLICSGEIRDTSNIKNLYKVERLNSIGIVSLTTKSIVIGNIGSRTDSYINLSDLGKTFTEIIFSN